jgi:hypothetical protein
VIWTLVALAGLAVLAAGFVVWVLAYAPTWPHQPTQPDIGRHREHDAAEPGDDDQFRRWRTVVPHIRRNANAEHNAIPADPERTGQ